MLQVTNLTDDKPAFAAGSAPDEELQWITVASGAPYFTTESGIAWTPIGQNDAITWPELRGVIGRRDLVSVKRYLGWLQESGVTCLRLMLEYCEDGDCYFESPAGCIQPQMITLWGDLVRLCQGFGLRLLLTPFDTFFTWNNWADHPYNRRMAGPAATEPSFCLALTRVN